MYKQYNLHICKFRQNIVVFSWLYFPPPNSLQLGYSFGKLLHHQRTAGAQALINHIGSIRICNATLNERAVMQGPFSNLCEGRDARTDDSFELKTPRGIGFLQGAYLAMMEPMKHKVFLQSNVDSNLNVFK